MAKTHLNLQTANYLKYGLAFQKVQIKTGQENSFRFIVVVFEVRRRMVMGVFPLDPQNASFSRKENGLGVCDASIVNVEIRCPLRVPGSSPPAYSSTALTFAS
jgi:hypothetical protein